ncbi:MAG TPA: hypothetical protein VMB25_26115 [Bryobacteraceae bacterium]|nr:hypothetical protein [Bryobacteraceae bacterium]
MNTKLTRREAAAALSASVAALAQTPQPSNPLPASADEELQRARAVWRENADTLARVALPMATEPAFLFKP